MARLDDLETLRDGLKVRLNGCESDQNYAVLGRLLADVLKQIEELGGDTAGADKVVTPLDEFTRRLADRESRPTGSRRTKGA